jgi:maltodextrin utilization protein YvdJ
MGISWLLLVFVFKFALSNVTTLHTKTRRRLLFTLSNNLDLEKSAWGEKREAQVSEGHGEALAVPSSPYDQLENLTLVESSGLGDSPPSDKWYEREAVIIALIFALVGVSAIAVAAVVVVCILRAMLLF